ncbi:MAG: glutaredoxin, partial [Gammaproteobacteria bacterium]|nr:glutaredoxin [Gammaproteobacteria bacterium]
TCPICDKTKALLSKWKIPYDEIRVDQSSDALKEMLRKTEFSRTVPQILVKDKWIGGFSELTELHMDGDLDDLVQK